MQIRSWNRINKQCFLNNFLKVEAFPFYVDGQELLSRLWDGGRHCQGASIPGGLPSPTSAFSQPPSVSVMRCHMEWTDLQT